MGGPGWCNRQSGAFILRDGASRLLRMRSFCFTSPRLRGEVGSPRRCEASSGAIRVRGYRSIDSAQLAERAPHPRPSKSELRSSRPREERGEGEARASLFRAKLSDFRIAREIVRALAIDRVHHHAL